MPGRVFRRSLDPEVSVAVEAHGSTIRDAAGREYLDAAGGAIVVTSAERARDLPRPPVFVLGTGEATGAAIFPKELYRPPRAWAEAAFDIVQWTEMPRGGHFAAMEEPELLVDDMRSFFRLVP